MKKLILLFLILPLCTRASKSNDSLHRELARHKDLHLMDSALVHLYLKLVDLNRRENPMHALQLAEEGKQVAISLRYRIGLANLFNKEGNVLYDLGFYSSALSSYHQCLLIFKKLGILGAVAYSHNDIGYVYHGRGLYDLAMAHFQQAIDIFSADTAFDYKAGLAHTYNNLGFSLQSKGLNDSAEKCFKLSLQLRQKLSIPQDIAQSFTYMGLLEKNKGHFARAIAHFNDAKNIYLLHQAPYFYGYTLMYEGETWLEQGNILSAQHYFQLAYQTFSEQQMELEIVKSGLHIVQIFGRQGQHEKAVNMAYELLQRCRLYSFQQQKLELLNTLKNLVEKGKFSKPIQEIQAELLQAQQEQLQQGIELNNSFVESYLALQKQKQQYIVTEKNNYINKLEKKLDLSYRNLLFLSLLFILILTFMLLANISHRKRTEEKMKSLEEQNLLLNSEKLFIYRMIYAELSPSFDKLYKALKLVTQQKDLFSQHEANQLLKELGGTLQQNDLQLMNLLTWTDLQLHDNIESFERQEKTISSVIKPFIASIAEQVRDHQLQVMDDTEDYQVILNPSKIQLVLANLFDFIVKNRIHDGVIRISNLQKMHKMQLMIRFKGEFGASKEAYEALQEPLNNFNLDNPSIALKISKLILKKHEGDLWTDSRADNGISFYFTLPLHSAPKS